MRITRQQADENRCRVVEAADAMFREKGFDAVPVAELMRAAGLSHGGFYNHFESKADLEAEAVRHACARSAQRIGRVAAMDAPARREALARFIDGYLSPEMRDMPASRCGLLAYGADMPRQGDAARAAFAQGLDAYLDNFAQALSGKDDPSARAEAIRAFSVMVGALYLARAAKGGDEKLSDEILAVVRKSLAPDAAKEKGGRSRP